MYRTPDGLPDRALLLLEQSLAPRRLPNPNPDHRSRVFQSLRGATAAAHHALDHHSLLHRLTGSDLTREQYAESLAAMYCPHLRLERLVHESGHHSASGLDLFTRVHLLEADLLELGWRVPEASQNPTDAPESRASWWGRVYVLEGSRRGAAVIARRIRTSLGDSVPLGFFGDAPLPDRDGALHTQLERALDAPEQLEQACASARAAFADYQAGLDAFDGRCASANVGQVK